ncbi:MAG: hypothetical protein ABIM74_08155 [candidate division WOR-3 bacterium]
MNPVYGLWFVVFGLNTQASDFPKRLEALGDFRAAAREYLREGDSVSAARCLLSQGDTGEAVRLLSGRRDTQSVILRARIYISQWRANEALGILEGLGGYGPADSLLILASIMLMDFGGAEEWARGDSGLLDVIAYAMETAPVLYSPQSAARLSCLPGLGHIYTDEPVKGLWAMALNAGIIGFIGYSVYKGITVHRSYYMDALLAYNFFFNRFYTGAGASAARSARHKNHKLLEDWLNRIATEKGFDPAGRWK